MLGQTNEEREGILLRRLKEVGHGGRPGRFGFVTGEAGAKRRPMLVVSRIKHGAKVRDEVLALAEAGVDGIEIAVRDGADTADIVEAAAAVDIPCGVFIAGEHETKPAITDLKGLDWIHVATTSPARLLAGGGATRLMTVSPDTAPERLAGLASLKVDVIVVDGAASGGTFTVDSLLALCASEAATKRPLLAGGDLGLTREDIAVLHDHGIEGVLVTGGVTAVKDYVKAIEAL